MKPEPPGDCFFFSPSVFLAPSYTAESVCASIGMGWRVTNGKLLVGFGVFSIVALIVVLLIHDSGRLATPTSPAPPDDNTTINASTHSSALGCQLGYDPTSLDIDCDVLIVGAGPGGLVPAHLLAPLLGSKLCMIDLRSNIGGKVQPVYAPQSTPSRILASPTHAEQYLSSHVHMRCLTQEVGEKAEVRGSWFRRPKHWEYISATGYNVTSICPLCWTWSVEKLLAPNGDPASKARYASQADGEKHGLPDLCNGLDYTECSMGDELWLRLLDTSNKTEKQAKDFAIFADYARHRFQSPEAASQYFGLSSGVGYIALSRDTPAGSIAGYEKVYEEWYGPATAFYWPLNGPHMVWKKVAEWAVGNGTRLFLNETATCFDKATDNRASTYKYVVRTNKRNIRAKRVVWATPPGQFVETVKGTLGMTLAARPEMSAVSTPFPQCSVELFFPNKWWAATRSQPTDPFYIDGEGNFDIIDTPAVRNITEWTFYDAVNGNWFRYIPHSHIREMNLIRFLPDVCEEWNEVYLNGGTFAVEARAIAIMKRLFEPNLNVTKPLKSAFTYEKFGFGHVNGRTNITTAQIIAFAKMPIAGEAFGFSAEGFQPHETGWQEGAFVGALNLFSAPALSGYYTAGALSNKVSKCSNSNGKKLDVNTPSISDYCLFLNNERPMWTDAGIDYCASKKRIVNQPSPSSNADHVRRDRLGPR